MTLAVINPRQAETRGSHIRPTEQVQGFAFSGRSMNFEEIPIRSMPMGEFAKRSFNRDY